MSCTLRQSPCAWRSACRRCPTPSGGLGAGHVWAAALGGCEWLESWKLGRTLDDAVLDLVRRLADAPLPDPPPVLRALLGHTLDEVLLRGLTALYSLIGCEEPQRQPDGDSDGAAVSATWLEAQYQELAEDEKRLGPCHPSVRERQATLDQLSTLLRQSQKRGTVTSTPGTSSWDPSRASSVAGEYDMTAVATAGGTSEVDTSDVVSSGFTTEVDDASPRGTSAAQDRKLTKRSAQNASLMPEWMLPGVEETDGEFPTGGSLTAGQEEDDEKTARKVHFSAEQLAQAQRASAALPCECCGAGQPSRPCAHTYPQPQPQPAPQVIHHEKCVCPCGKTTHISVVKHPECVCNEPSSDYFTGRGTSAMPSSTEASPEIKRKAKELTDAIIAEAQGTGDAAVSKAADKATSARSSTHSAPCAPLAEKAGDGGTCETDWHSAESTPRLKSAAHARPEVSALWTRSSPCPCCPPRRRRPRAPGNRPEQILWAITKICVYSDASCTYEVLTPTFDKPPKVSGRAHVLFAMRAPPDKSPAPCPR